MGEMHASAGALPVAQPLQHFYERHERAIALGAFVLGFVFDVLTLPRVDSWLAITQQALYIAAITAVLVHMLIEKAGTPAPAAAAGPASWYRRYRNVGVHFLFGSLLNLYTIYYFKSASLIASFAFMLALVLLLAANESRRFKTMGLPVKFALLALCVLSFSAHVVPIFVGAIGPLVFLASMLVGAMLLIGVAAGVAAAPGGGAPLARRHVLAPLGLVLTAYLAFYLLRLTPPVPLSMPFIGVYHSVERTAEGYRLAHERPRWRFWETGDQAFRAQPGDRVHVFFRIYSPTAFSEQVLVRWFHSDEKAGWTPQGSVRVNITGGRAEGFRGYAWKANYRPGRWKVQVETTDGREIGRIHVRLSLVPAAPRQFAIEVQ